MKTLIFEAENSDVSGFVEYGSSNDAIELNYNVKSENNENNLLKIYALSSKKPFNKPIIADTLEFKANTASGNRRISNSSLFQNGFSVPDIDTFAVVKIGDSDLVEASCFSEAKWDVQGAFENIGICAFKNPVERGTEIMNSIKERTKTINPEAQKMWIDKLLKTVCQMKKSDISPVSEYKWYISNDMRPPLPLSAYRHLLFVTEVMTEFDREGFYLFGVKEDGHTALSIKSERFNPFVNANDCAVKIDDYYVVGVYLAPDGQYFEKIEI